MISARFLTRALSLGLKAVLVGLAIPVTLTTSPAADFALNARIMPKSGGANVRALPTAPSGIFEQHSGAHGVVVEGPIVLTEGANAVVHWRVQWESAPPDHVDEPHWSLEAQLMPAPLAGVIAPPNFNSLDYTTSNIFYIGGNAPNATDKAKAEAEKEPFSLDARGNCTWYAHGRLRELGYDPGRLGRLAGDASTWDNSAVGKGFVINTEPRPGAIAQSDVGARGWGHVAVVEAVHDDGTITVTESSYSESLSSEWNFLWRHRTVPAAPVSDSTGFQHYIHVPPQPPKLVEPGKPPGETLLVADLQPILRWKSVPGAEGYRVYVSESPYGSANIVHEGTIQINQSQLTVAHQLPSGVLRPDTAYRWNVASIGSYGQISEPSDRLYFRTPLPQNARILNLRGESATSITFSADSRLVIVGLESGRVVIWDPFSGQPYRVIQASTMRINAVAFRQLDSRIVVGSSDRKLSFWNLDGTLLSSANFGIAVTEVSFSQDNTLLAVGLGTTTFVLGMRPQVILYPAAGGQPIRSFGSIAVDGFYDKIAFSPVDSKILTAMNSVWSGETKLWNRDNGAMLRTFESGRHNDNGVDRKCS